MKAVFGTLIVLFSVFAHADLQTDYSALKDHGRNLQDTGTICEEVAVLEMQRQYGPEYTVLSGIEYSDSSRVLGELDLIVFNNKNHDAVLIGEVKCWKSMGGGLKKAHEQRKRFLKSLNSNQVLNFRLKDDPSMHFTMDQFMNAEEFISIAQKGGQSAGYDLELEHSLSELMTLRDMILKCQKTGACKKAVR